MTCPHCLDIDRRALLGLLGVGVASVLAGCADSPRNAVAVRPGRAAAAAAGVRPSPRPAAISTPAPALPPIPPPAPAPSQVFWQRPPAAVAARQVAITIDDGFCAECAQAYAALAEATGIHIT
jgi:peptidoglycan-N-acetylglucosamine deacetylase